MLSIQAFRIRNLALRLKQKKTIQSIFIRNDKVSVRLPGQKRYDPVGDCNKLLRLVGTIFFSRLSCVDVLVRVESAEAKIFVKIRSHQNLFFCLVLRFMKLIFCGLTRTACIALDSTLFLNYSDEEQKVVIIDKS
ncbi:AAEL006198-PA [Aedes aegypti]|uniref:AAEL006198-PA n=1 Tax=Aedes aegypti TaxID=7159 RepID=Q177A8_AEDAE|nr:AAEL006198-PA [Aedes aegypti]